MKSTRDGNAAGRVSTRAAAHFQKTRARQGVRETDTAGIEGRGWGFGGGGEEAEQGLRTKHHLAHSVISEMFIPIRSEPETCDASISKTSGTLKEPVAQHANHCPTSLPKGCSLVHQDQASERERSTTDHGVLHAG